MLKEIQEKAKSLGITFGDQCEGDLISKGYTYNDCFGWEKTEVLQRFNLNPDMEKIPGIEIKDFDIKETKTAIKDEFGNKTGEYKLKQERVETPKIVRIPSPNWMNYLRYKKEQEIINANFDGIILDNY